MTQDLNPTGTQEQINIAQKTKIDAHDNKIDTLQTISIGVILVLFLGLLSLLASLEAMRRESDQFKSQLFIELIKETHDTNLKINTLIK